MKLSRATVFLFASFLLTASCSPDQTLDEHFAKKSRDIIDPDRQLNRGDYRNIHAPRNIRGDEPPIPGMAPNIRVEEEISLKPGNIVEPAIPDIAQIIAAPKPPKIGHSKLVSVAITDDVPLKDVLIELARLADVDIEVDAGIYGGISFRAKDRPFNEVIERIANLAGLRYSMRNNILRIERDSAYIQVYSLDFINVDREVTSSITVNSTGGGSTNSGNSGGGGGGASGGGENGGGGGTTNTSSASITTASKNDFWQQLEKAIDSILKFNPTPMLSLTTTQAQPITPQGNLTADDGRVGKPVPQNKAPAPAQVSNIPPAAQNNFYILNRQAGTLTISATEKQHDIVKRYLDAMEKNVSSQVLIEAKIVEVSLNERYQSGIDWARFGNQNVSYTGAFDTIAAASTGANPATINIIEDKLFGTGFDLNVAVNLLDEFGAARAISSPRLHAMNNQQAVLTFAENIVYFDIGIEVTPGTAGTASTAATLATVEVESEQKTIPVGLLLTLQPTINYSTSEITLNVRPTLTKIIKFVPNPAFDIQKLVALNNLSTASASSSADLSDLIAQVTTSTNNVPQIETRELDSVLKIKSGQVMVIGGLLEDSASNIDAGVPGASEIPFFGNLFKSVDKQNTKKELVIFIRATIVPSSGSADAADRRVYEKFFDDPRPLKF